jgi:diketogulonate reductase-like aldo/keto reductase
MEHRTLGKTNEKVPLIGMGTWAMGNRPSGSERSNEIEALRRGTDLGMSLIDTAEMYGYGKCERLVAEAIRDRRDDVFVATKISPDHFHYDDVLESCEASLQRLSVKSIDLYQLHWPNPRIPIKETMRAMEQLVSLGKIRYIGVSNFSIEQTMEAQESLSKNEVVSNQVRYSITSRSIEHSLLPYLERENITVIAYSPLDTGRLPQSRIPKEMLDKYGMTAAQVMLSWVVQKERIIAIPKAAQIKHVEENAETSDVRLSNDDYKRLSEIFG